jgi:glucokinase
MKLALGVDIGGTNISAGIVNRAGKLVYTQTIPTQASQGGPVLIKRVKDLLKGILSAQGIKRQALTGIGVGCPGSVDFPSGIILAATPNIPHWQGLQIKRELAREFHLPVVVDNDVNVMALGEKTWGAGQGARNLFCLTLGTGIGGGAIINHQVYRGSYFYAGEIGHLCVAPDGPRCSCGHRGCLEALAGGKGIVRRTREAVRKYHGKTKIRALTGNHLQGLTAQVVFDAARKNDRLARLIVQDTGYYIGLALSYVINILDPQLIIIGGRIARAGEILFRPIRATASAFIIQSPTRTPRIVPARLGEKAGIFGAAALAFQEWGIKR